MQKKSCCLWECALRSYIVWLPVEILRSVHVLLCIRWCKHNAMKWYKLYTLPPSVFHNTWYESHHFSTDTMNTVYMHNMCNGAAWPWVQLKIYCFIFLLCYPWTQPLKRSFHSGTLHHDYTMGSFDKRMGVEIMGFSEALCLTKLRITIFPITWN